MCAFHRGHLLYHPAQWYEARYLRNRALDLVELRSRNVGYNYRGQPGLTTTDQSKVVGFSSFAAALLHLAQLKANFGGESKASLRLNRQRRAAPRRQPAANYSSCHDVAKLYSVRLHSGDMVHIRDIAPVICRGFVIFQVSHAKRPQGERRAPPSLSSGRRARAPSCTLKIQAITSRLIASRSRSRRAMVRAPAPSRAAADAICEPCRARFHALRRELSRWPDCRDPQSGLAIKPRHRLHPRSVRPFPPAPLNGRSTRSFAPARSSSRLWF
jgi:hypothetical protein